MIVNTTELCYVVVELDAEDISKILKGQHVLKQNCCENDHRDVLVSCYCHNPQDFKK